MHLYPTFQMQMSGCLQIQHIFASKPRAPAATTFWLYNSLRGFVNLLHAISGAALSTPEARLPVHLLCFFFPLTAQKMSQTSNVYVWISLAEIAKDNRMRLNLIGSHRFQPAWNILE